MIPEQTFEYSDVIEELSLDGKFLHLGEDFARCGWVDDKPACTEPEYNTALSNAKKKYKNKEYIRNRLKEYPDLQECIHAILDDDLTALQAKRKLVKEKYPKP